jgi:hypothetical protein
VRQLFTLPTAVLNLVVWLAALAGSLLGLYWLAVAGWFGVLVVTTWTVYAARRAGHDPFPDLRDVDEGRGVEGPREPAA